MPIMYHAQSYQLHSGCRRSFFLALHVGPHVRKLGENRGERERSFMPKENAQSKILLRAFFFSKERGKYIYGTLINIYGTLKNIKKKHETIYSKYGKYGKTDTSKWSQP